MILIDNKHAGTKDDPIPIPVIEHADVDKRLPLKVIATSAWSDASDLETFRVSARSDGMWVTGPTYEKIGGGVEATFYVYLTPDLADPPNELFIRARKYLKKSPDGSLTSGVDAGQETIYFTPEEPEPDVPELTDEEMEDLELLADIVADILLRRMEGANKAA